MPQTVIPFFFAGKIIFITSLIFLENIADKIQIYISWNKIIIIDARVTYLVKRISKYFEVSRIYDNNFIRDI